MRLKQIWMGIATLGMFGLIGTTALSQTLHAAPEDTPKCGGVETTIISCEAKNKGDVSDNGVWALLMMVLNILTAGVGIIAVGGIVYGAILYTTAEDKADQVKHATGIITNVVIGLILFALMWVVLNFIVPGGVFSDAGRDASTDQNSSVASEPAASTESGGGSNSGGASGGGNQPAPTAPSLDDIAVRNFRDASTSSSGSVLKAGMLLRSPQLDKIGPKDAKELGQIMGSDGLIIDLRQPDQRAASPDKAIPGVGNINIPIAGILDTTPMVTDSSQRSQLGKALKAAANAKGPVLIHCFAGKDRTGWTVAMIMYAAGATDAQVMKEYLKSNDEPIAGGVQSAWLQNGIQAMRNQYKTPKGYLKATGLSDADISKLAKKFGA